MLDIRCCQLEIFTMQNKRSKIREWKVQGISRIFLKNLIFSPRQNQESVSEKSKEIIKESASTRWYLQNSLCRKFAKEKQKPAEERMTTKKTKSGTHPPPTQTRDAANRQQAAENQQKKEHPSPCQARTSQVIPRRKPMRSTRSPNPATKPEPKPNHRESESTPINQHSASETTKKAKDHNQNVWRTQKTMKRERNEACRAENTAQTTKASQSSPSERRA